MGVRVRQIPFALWVIAGSFAYAGLVLLVFAGPALISQGILGFGGFLVIILLFTALFFIAAAFSLRQKRWAYILGSVVGIVLVLLFSPFIATSLSNPADETFWLGVSLLPALFLGVLFSVLSFRNAKAGLTQKKYVATPMSTGGLLTIAVIGFVVGSLVVGAVGGGVIVQNLRGPSPDVTIVEGAASAMVAYSPATFTINVGGTVTWINKDLTGHTVTNQSGLFDSGPFTTGQKWSHTFNAPGTYRYYCTIHPMMVGTIVVV